MNEPLSKKTKHKEGQKCIVHLLFAVPVLGHWFTANHFLEASPTFSSKLEICLTSSWTSQWKDGGMLRVFQNPEASHPAP